MDELIYKEQALNCFHDWFDKYGDVHTPDEIKEYRAIEALPSVEAEPQWIPCSERLPEDLEEANVTWVNHAPEQYYDFVKDKHFTGSALYYKGSWYWYSSTCVDILAEYGRNEMDKIDDGIEVIAWMPLPDPYDMEE